MGCALALRGASGWAFKAWLFMGWFVYELQRRKTHPPLGLPVALAPPFSPRSPLGCFRRRFPWLPRVLVELKRPISWVPRIYLLTLSS